MIEDDRFRLHVSTPLVAEYESVLKRGRLALSESQIDDVIDFICARATHHQIFYLWRPFLRDPNDDMVLEVAVEAQCPFIITFNTRDFVGVEQFGIQTLTPGQFLARLLEDA